MQDVRCILPANRPSVIAAAVLICTYSGERMSGVRTCGFGRVEVQRLNVPGALRSGVHGRPD